MKNLVLTFLLALLVVLTCVSIRRMVGGTSFAGQKPTLIAIGVEPVPPLPKPTQVAIGVEPVPPLPKPTQVAIGVEPVPPLPKPKN